MKKKNLNLPFRSVILDRIWDSDLPDGIQPVEYLQTEPADQQL